MRVEIESCHPFDKHIEEGIAFDVELDFSGEKKDMVPIEVSGRVESKDKKTLARLQEWVPEREGETKISHLYADGTSVDAKDQTYNAKLYGLIGERGVEHIDKLREETAKDDVFLNIILEVRVLRSQSVIPSLHRVPFQDTELSEPEEVSDHTKNGLVTYEYTQDRDPSQNDLWVISGDGGANFLSTAIVRSVEPGYRIPSSDWVDEFLPEFGFGNRITFEFPDTTELENEEEELAESLKVAFEELDRAKSDLQRGEWRSVVSHMLGVYDAIDTSEVEEDLWDLEEMGYTKQAEGKLIGLQSNFGDYLGKFRHRRGKDKELQEKAEPHREDARFMFSMMAGLVQLLSEKHLARNGIEEK